MEEGNGCFSASYISPDRVFTYGNLKSGLVFDVDNNNIINASNENIGSGTYKDLQELIDFSFSNKYVDTNRINFSEKYKEHGKLNNQKYSRKYKELSQYHSLTDIEDANLRKLVDQVVNKTMLNNSGKHNEVVVYAPKPIGIFSKETSPEKIPYHLRLFAQESDLPIIMVDEPTPL